MFQCEMCQYKTKYKSSIKSHLLVHKDDSEVPMFQCEMCDYKAKRRNCIRTHLLVHKDSSEVEMFPM
ncbi:hypothetical protein NQ317_007904 [Molorchus minor]|uniref:C2H2-type domain-containing protein n=1 Tax=Molorchus minor TaxID=1323400 RepID=A0ABQ9JU68_9CUCU|nr:hypothetical protein NQ317_007904 [Molorchus minor]